METIKYYRGNDNSYVAIHPTTKVEWVFHSYVTFLLFCLQWHNGILRSPNHVSL